MEGRGIKNGSPLCPHSRLPFLVSVLFPVQFAVPLFVSFSAAFPTQAPLAFLAQIPLYFLRGLPHLAASKKHFCKQAIDGFITSPLYKSVFCHCVIFSFNDQEV